MKKVNFHAFVTRSSLLFAVCRLPFAVNVMLKPLYFSSGVGAGPKRRKRATQGGSTSEPQLDSQMSEEEEEGFENPDALDSDYKSREELTMIMAQFDPVDLIPYGHSFEDLVISCTYRGISCR